MTTLHTRMVDRVVPWDEHVEQAWDDLADRLDAPPHLRPGWTRAWCGAFGRGSVEIHTACEGDRIVAAVPVQVRGPLRVAPVNWHTPAFEILGASDRAKRLVARSLYSPPARIVSLALVSDEASVDAAVHAAHERGYRTLVHTMESAPAIDIGGSWEDFEQGLAKRMRSELRRRWRRLSEEGALEYQLVESSDRLDHLLDEGFRVEGLAWKAEQGTAINSDERVRRFYRDLAHWATGQGLLRLHFLRLDGRAVAFAFGVAGGGVHYALKSGYDPALSKLSPGSLVHWRMIEHAFRDGARRFDFGGRAEPWKLDWTNHAVDRRRIRAFAPDPLGRLARAAFAHGRPAAKRLLGLVRRDGNGEASR